MAQVTDPVCGMTIDSHTAAGSSTWHGETYYFCAEACKRKFDANPAQYTGGQKNKRTAQEPPFTKTGPLLAPKFGAAGSGGAEYDPGPDTRKPS